MKQRELTKTVMMISNLKKPFGILVYIKNVSGLWGLTGTEIDADSIGSLGS